MERRRTPRAEGLAEVVTLIAAAAASAERPPADEWPGWPGPCIRITGVPISPENMAALLGEPLEALEYECPRPECRRHMLVPPWFEGRPYCAGKMADTLTMAEHELTVMEPYHAPPPE